MRYAFFDAIYACDDGKCLNVISRVEAEFYSALTSNEEKRTPRRHSAMI